jgi:hypothetical protein
MKAVRFARLLALAIPVAGCSSTSTSSPKPPVIDNLQLPASVTGSANVYTIQGTISFHDDDDQVTTLHVKIPNTNIDNKDAVTPASTGTNVALKLVLTTASPVSPGTVIEIDISLIDQAGAESAVLQEHVTLN